jgi:hypothetical protein
MRTCTRATLSIVSALFALFLLGGINASPLAAKDKRPSVSSDDPTLRLYNLLDSKFGGKIKDFYLLADTFNDAKTPGQTQQHLICLDYDKSRAFGKLQIRVRNVIQPTPDQLKTYTPKQIYDFAETDDARFNKTDPGPMGTPGDIYLAPTSPDGPLGTATVTPEVQAQYDRYVTQYLLPALEKKASAGSGL